MIWIAFYLAITMKTWLIEYEIPPLRAIYHAETDCETEAEARKVVEEDQPQWRIRKVTLKTPPICTEPSPH